MLCVLDDPLHWHWHSRLLDVQRRPKVTGLEFKPSGRIDFVFRAELPIRRRDGRCARFKGEGAWPGGGREDALSEVSGRRIRVLDRPQTHSGAERDPNKANARRKGKLCSACCGTISVESWTTTLVQDQIMVHGSAQVLLPACQVQ